MLRLRGYQQRAVEQARDAFRSGARGVALVLPTGSGKTVIASHIAAAHLSRGGRVVVLCHRRELIQQTEAKLRAYGLSPGPLYNVAVESVQTAVRRAPSPASLVILDECHHFGEGAATWSELPRAYAAAHRLGLTATPQRGDGSPLVGFDRLVAPVSPRELTELGHLVPCDVIAPSKGGDLADPVAALEEYAPGRPAVIFCASVRHAGEVARQIGPDAASVDGDMPEAERDSVLQRFQRGELRVLTNCYVLTEGWDAPRAEVCVVGRGCGAAATWLQMVGRVLRPEPGKARALVIDCKGSVYQHGLPTDDREWSLTGKAHALRARLPSLRQCPECGGVARSAPTCPRCGYAFPPPKLPQARRMPMVTVDTVTPDTVKRGHLRGLLGHARRKGYQPGWAAYQFKARWGFWPPREWMTHA